MLTSASKPLASLSSGLLARKGQARPAMRPQGFASLAGIAPSLEDLGWNDMGSGEPAVPAVAETPQEVSTPVPQVLAEREVLREGIENAAPEPQALPQPEPIETETIAEAAPEPLLAARPVSVATATRLARESTQQTRKGGKAAFTLRLDGERHLRLRLASALTGRSAQQLVAGAVDEMIRGIAEVDLLVAQLPPAKTSSR